MVHDINNIQPFLLKYCKQIIYFPLDTYDLKYKAIPKKKK